MLTLSVEVRGEKNHDTLIARLTPHQPPAKPGWDTTTFVPQLKRPENLVLAEAYSHLLLANDNRDIENIVAWLTRHYGDPYHFDLVTVDKR